MLVVAVTAGRARLVTSCRPGWVGLAVLGLGAALGGNAGPGLHPARELAGRAVASMLGWQPAQLWTQVFSYCPRLTDNGNGTKGSWFGLSGVAAQHLGGLAGAALYRVLVWHSRPVSKTDSSHAPRSAPAPAPASPLGSRESDSLLNLFPQAVRTHFMSTFSSCNS